MHLLTGAYAIGALDEVQRRRFEHHLATCATCAEEVRGLELAAAQLGVAEFEEPPSGMRAAVLSRIDAVRQLPPRPPGAVRRGYGPWGARLLATATAVLLVAVVALAVVTAQLRAQVADLRAGTALVTAVLAAPDARTVTADVRTGGRAVVGVSQQRGAAVIVGTGLALLPPDLAYQLWFVGPDGARSAGLLEPDPAGSASQPLSGSPLGAVAIAVTVERAGGAPQPTGDPVLTAGLPA